MNTSEPVQTCGVMIISHGKYEKYIKLFQKVSSLLMEQPVDCACSRLVISIFTNYCLYCICVVVSWIQLKEIRERYAALEAEYLAMRKDNKKKITHYMDNVAGRRIDTLHKQILGFEATLSNSHLVSAYASLSPYFCAQ